MNNSLKLPTIHAINNSKHTNVNITNKSNAHNIRLQSVPIDVITNSPENDLDFQMVQNKSKLNLFFNIN